MEARTKSTIFEGSAARVFQFYLQNSDEHTAVVRFLEDHLPAEFKRMAADKNELAVLGVGSGGGEVDVQILSLLQSTFSTLPITADIVEGSVELLANFKAGRSWDTLWRTSEELEDNETPRYRSSEDVLASLKTLGLKYEEYSIPNTFDITECFDPNSTIGQGLLCYLTSTPDFYKSFTPQIRSDILKLIRSKCSTEKDGKILFDNCLSCVFVHA
ncbi:histamine N-methyltransferase-like isoform X2 [Hippocampus zosterae]|uniref:histamine N-methyltransferase-like isoform X2 n=1 Tax=Hippocampus zosterae TaxID=109293 RepID=UPI00223DDFED|nr:histamine N-methyltransferase-like isoform X2 [Hippocampus zosterae]